MNQLIEIANSLSDDKIIDIMMQLGADRYQVTKEAIIFPTICHNVDSMSASMKLYYYPSTHCFHCYTGCSCSFNIYEVFKKRYELFDKNYDFYKDIVLKLDTPIIHQDKFGNFSNNYESIYQMPNYNVEVHMPKLNKGLLNIYEEAYTSEWINDNISVQAMKHYNIKYSMLENKIIIPHYDIDNNLIGIRGRTLNEEEIAFGKYMPVKIEDKIYSHPLGYNLYGLNQVKDNIRKFKMAIVAEGEKSVLQYETMYGADKNIVVATCGNSFHKYQLELLLKLGVEKVLIAFDKTGETNKERENYFMKLKNICKKCKNYCSMGFLYDFNGLLKLKQSPFDCGKDTFEQLFKKGVWL